MLLNTPEISQAYKTGCPSLVSLFEVSISFSLSQGELFCTICDCDCFITFVYMLLIHLLLLWLLASRKTASCVPFILIILISLLLKTLGVPVWRTHYPSMEVAVILSVSLTPSFWVAKAILRCRGAGGAAAAPRTAPGRAGLCGAEWGGTGPCGAMRGHTGPYGAIWSCVGWNGAMRGHAGPCGRPCCCSWSHSPKRTGHVPLVLMGGNPGSSLMGIVLMEGVWLMVMGSGLGLTHTEYKSWECFARLRM